MTSVTQRRPLTESQRQSLQALPEVENSVFPQVRGTIPAASYVDPARFSEEMTGVFKAVPVIAGPSALIPKPRSYFQVDLAGVPTLITRDKDGQAKAFANVCRHRGMKLCAAKDPVEGSRIVCAYHAWTYGLDGELAGIPRQESFPGIDKSSLGLIALPCVEAGGLLWVGLDPARAPDFSLVAGPVGDELAALGLDAMYMYDKAIIPVRANWKLVMDSMLDNYHVTRLHKDSVGRFFVDAENVIVHMGPHMGVTSARSNFKRELITDNFDELRKIMVFSYTPFPNGIIVVSPNFVSVAILRPIAVDQSEVDYYLLANEAPANDEAESKLRRSFDLMRTVFGEEDYWAAEMCHQGLSSGLMPEVQVGGMELQIPIFHASIEKCLAEARSRATPNK